MNLILEVGSTEKCGDMKKTRVNSNLGVRPENKHMSTVVHSYVLGRCEITNGSIKYLRPGLVPNSLLSTICLTVSNKHLLVCPYSSTWLKIKVIFKCLTIHIYLNGKCLYALKLMQAFRVNLNIMPESVVDKGKSMKYFSKKNRMLN